MKRETDAAEKGMETGDVEKRRKEKRNIRTKVEKRKGERERERKRRQRQTGRKTANQPASQPASQTYIQTEGKRKERKQGREKEKCKVPIMDLCCLMFATPWKLIAATSPTRKAACQLRLSRITGRN